MMGNVLSVKNLSIQIKERILIHNVSFNIGQGEAVLLSGANGSGKSTILKSIARLDTKGKKISGEIINCSFGDILTLNAAELQRYHSCIAYIQQRDEYAEIRNIQVRDIISDSRYAHTGGMMSFSEVNDLIDEWIPRRSDNSRVFDAKSKPAKLSGGEQRLLSVLSIIATRPQAELIIIDEPLNNLDVVNARNISNLINKVLRNNSKTGLLMVSHCRIFPFITREIKLTSGGISEVRAPYIYHSCFGEPDEEGFYR